MEEHGVVYILVAYLSAAVIAVPIFARLGLGSVLGYLCAGIIIGPWVLGLITNVEEILHFSEFGVVLLLFLIGLELEPRKLWNMRKPILGAGGAQVLVSAAIIFGVAMLFGARWQTAVVAGLGLALSSTAIVLQILGEKSLLNTPAGKTGFSILLFQDIAVIPIIALIPLLGFELIDGGGTAEVSTLTIVAVIAGIFLIGRFVLKHVLNFVASVHLREVFTALSLLLVVGIAMIMDMIGVSMALGAFVAGVLMADSPYRHALESDIEPFKGLLLGLFFVSVGMSMDFGLLWEKPFQIIFLTALLLLIKGCVLYVIGKVAKLPANQTLFFPLLLAQGGEFAFVLFGFASAAGAMETAIVQLLTLVVALSMALTPLFVVLHTRFIEPRFVLQTEREPDEIPDDGNSVIIVGFGRFGQVIARLLLANKITPTLIDHNPDQIERSSRFGYKSYYGDALRLDVLHSAGAANAKVIVLSIDDQETVNQAVKLIKHEFPNAKIVVRAYDRGHAMELIEENIAEFARETFYSALHLGKKVLVNLGFSPEAAERRAETLRTMDIDTMIKQAAVRHDLNEVVSIAHSARENLEETLAADNEELKRIQKETPAPNTS
ncbi:MAG: glutathione-regulated potassium-efflux system protein KefC [Acidiferrobacterales bacterium]|nr:glutathione-regulated potassium-efflux system protein KefC [Acidiferrobacterales bacterium]